MSESLSTAGAATLNTPPRSFSPAGCTACGNPDAACRPHGHGTERVCFAYWRALIELRSRATRYGWRVAAVVRRSA